ncbi:hypothetical protein B0H12DRAFT_1324896 [Mycena haematopus]|nr:hypothetical protein B0H12DRAFT_1324896 [Mycena haematopus]
MSRTSSAINYLVSFLTRPLLTIYSPATILALQLSLHSSFSSAPAKSLLLSAKCPPPLPLQRACAVAGIRWAEWTRLLSQGLDVHIFITASSVAVALGRMPRRTVWIALDNSSLPAAKPASPPVHSSALLPAAPRGSARLRTTFASVRTRSCRGAALNPTHIPTLLSSSYNAEDVASDSDSDSDSETSDSGLSFTSSSSTTSASTAASSSPCASPYPAVTAISTVSRYAYHGGVTQVVGSRVMLGPPVFSHRRPSGRPGNTARKIATYNWCKST